jgi:hypothetical protein
MDARTATTVSDILRRLPSDGAGRDLALLRLTDLYAEREATAAVRAAAARARETLRQREPGAEAVANAVSAASALSELGATVRADLAVDLAQDAVHRDELSGALLAPAFLALVPAWTAELRSVASTTPASGACTVATALQLWSWTISHVRATASAASVSELAQALSPLIAARAQILEVVGEAGASSGRAGAREFFLDLCHVQAARAAGEVGTLCAAIVFGSRPHPAWNAEGCAACYQADDLDELEGLIPGIASSARAHSDVVERDGSHPVKAGPCAKADGLDTFIRLRTKLDGCLTGARLARSRAAAALSAVLAGTSTTR